MALSLPAVGQYGCVLFGKKFYNSILVHFSTVKRVSGTRIFIFDFLATSLLAL